jgi:uncharacterized protein (DUF2236 family)
MERLAPELAPADRAGLVALADGAPGRALALMEAGAVGLAAELASLSSPEAVPALARRFRPAAAAAGFALLCQLVPDQLAALARARADHRLAALYTDVSALAARAVPQAFDRVAVAYRLLIRLVEARALAGAR